ncbi:UNVERIFIED_CONTAM: hypothetical protein K2H54_076133 [Gekko kuhli]
MLRRVPFPLLFSCATVAPRQGHRTRARARRCHRHVRHDCASPFRRGSDVSERTKPWRCDGRTFLSRPRRCHDSEADHAGCHDPCPQDYSKQRLDRGVRTEIHIEGWKCRDLKRTSDVTRGDRPREGHVTGSGHNRHDRRQPRGSPPDRWNCLATSASNEPPYNSQQGIRDDARQRNYG